MLLALVQAPANAYDRDAAVAYADNWWNAKSAAYPQGFDNDCTNYISQVMHAGGIRFRSAPFSWAGSYSTSQYWDAQGGAATYWTTTWSVAQQNATWVNGLGGSSMVGFGVGNQPAQPPVGYRGRGNPVYYDWGDDGDPNIDHATIITVSNGTPSDGSGSGTLVNGHTSNRYHTNWDLWAFNPHKASTRYFIVAIADGAS